jgi:hypothetical protein
VGGETLTVSDVWKLFSSGENFKIGGNSIATRYANFQAWLGVAVDPEATWGNGTVAKSSQAATGFGAVNSALIGQVVAALVAGGVDPTYGLTVANIESAYKTQGGALLFELTLDEVNNVAGVPGDYTKDDQQTNAFIQLSNGLWAETALANFPTGDPTGVYRWTVYNQGVTGAEAIWQAPDKSAKISTLPNYLTHILNQAFAGSLTGDNTIQELIDAIDSYWTTQQTDAASRLTGTIEKNINAFISPALATVPPITAACLFGIQDILFEGDITSFKDNGGVAGAFTYTGSALQNSSTTPIVGQS